MCVLNNRLTFYQIIFHACQPHIFIAYQLEIDMDDKPKSKPNQNNPIQYERISYTDMTIANLFWNVKLALYTDLNSIITNLLNKIFCI